MEKGKDKAYIKNKIVENMLKDFSSISLIQYLVLEKFEEKCEGEKMKWKNRRKKVKKNKK